MITPTRGVRHALASIVPNWLANRVTKNAGYKVLFVIALICDLFIDIAMQALAAAWPGSIGTPTALGLIGQSRRIVRGYLETDASYSSRLRNWLAYWYDSGSDEVLGQALQAYIGGGLGVSVITRGGRFVVAGPTGTLTATDTRWNWDGNATPSRADRWADIWIVIYVDNRWPTYSTTWANPTWRGAPHVFGVGHQVPRYVADDIRQIVHDIKGAHAWVVAIIVTNDSTVFMPGANLLSVPDGNYANFSKRVNGQQVPARATSTFSGGYIRYWIPSKGG